MKEASTPSIVSRPQWEQARAELLVREKEHTHAGDALSAARRRLPMTLMAPLKVLGANGPVTLQDVFEGRRMLLVYHFMWKPGGSSPPALRRLHTQPSGHDRCRRCVPRRARCDLRRV